MNPGAKRNGSNQSFPFHQGNTLRLDKSTNKRLKFIPVVCFGVFQHHPSTPQILLLIQPHQFKLAVNGSHLFEFRHRVQDLSSIDQLEIMGDLELIDVKLWWLCSEHPEKPASPQPSCWMSSFRVGQTMGAGDVRADVRFECQVRLVFHWDWNWFIDWKTWMMGFVFVAPSKGQMHDRKHQTDSLHLQVWCPWIIYDMCIQSIFPGVQLL